MTINVSELSTQEVFTLYRSTVSVLRDRNVVRSENIAGDYAEYLVARAVGGTLAPPSEKGWDVIGSGDEHIQVKARVVSDPIRQGQRQLSVFRSFEFDAVVIVLLSDTDYRVVRAVMLPPDLVREKVLFREHVHGSVLLATDAVLGDERAIDVTEEVASAAG